MRPLLRTTRTRGKCFLFSDPLIASFLFCYRAAIFVIYNFPIVKKATLEGLEAIFQTKAIARQLFLAIALETGMVRKDCGTLFFERYCDVTFFLRSLFFPSV